MQHSSRFSYYAYGLGIHSELPIPEFLPAKVGCDVTIKVETKLTIADYLPQEVIEEPLAISLQPQKAIVYLQGTGLFLLHGGSTITIVPEVNASQELLRNFLIGTVMATLLHQKGLLVLHASVVNIDGNGVAFLGDSGEGKSSLAAAFHAQGDSIVTDDVAAVNITQSPAMVSPSFPQLKLCEEVADTLGYEWDALYLLPFQMNKRGYRLVTGFPRMPLPLKGIYILTTGSELQIEVLSPSEAVMAIMRHSELDTFFHSGHTAHWQLCVALARDCPVYRLQRPRNLALLSKGARLLREHILSKEVAFCY